MPRSPSKPSRRRRLTNRAIIRQAINKARWTARKRGLEFDLDVALLLPLIPKQCPLLGTVLSPRGHRDSSPSIDRINPSRGYTMDNVWIISARANRIKNDATLEELIRIALNFAKALHGP